MPEAIRAIQRRRAVLPLIALAAAAAVILALRPPFTEQADAACNAPNGTQFDVTLTGDTLLCLGDTADYSATLTGGTTWPGTFDWTVEIGSFTTDQTHGTHSTATVTAEETGVGTVTVLFTPDPPATGQCRADLDVRVVDVDLDVDADYDDQITVEDDPGDPNDDDSLETTSGGLVGAGRTDALRLDVRGGEDTATVRLSWTNESKVEVRNGSTVLDQAAAAGAPEHPQWEVADLPLELDVEGLVVSDAHRDVEFTLKYDDLPTCRDKVNMTVAETDLDIDTDNDSTVEDDADDPDEDESPGHVLMVNWDNDNNDDDNGDGTIDNDDRDCDDHLWETGDDDCSELVLRLDPDDLPDAHKVVLTVDDPELVRVFDASNEAILGPFTEVDAAGNPGSPVTEWEKELSAISLPASDLTFHVEGVEPGVATLTLTYYTDTGLEIHSDEVKAAVLPPPLVPDYDRDGEIADIDSSRAVGRETFHFWINDDDDFDVCHGKDAPGQTYPDADPGGGWVDYERDLIDFFPVWLDLAFTLLQFPASEYTYTLWHETVGGYGNLNVLFDPGLDCSNANLHIFDLSFCQTHASDQLDGDIDGTWGHEIPGSLLDDISAGNEVVMLLEARAATSTPLTLKVVRDSDNSVVMAFDLPLRLSSVEDMYRHINLRGDGGGHPDQRSEPPGYPDNLCTVDRNLFYTHGFKVDGDAARSEHAEMFKRLYWAGSRAKYWALYWRGNEGSDLNYQENAHNAFETAAVLAADPDVSGTPNKVFIAHSLGNMLISSAIQDHGVNALRYIMLNAAVAAECYESTTFNDNTVAGNPMAHHDWLGYDADTLAATWHELFASSPGDLRAELTWKDRFPSIGPPFAFNIYSSGDTVLEVMPQDGNTLTSFSGTSLLYWLWERYCWQKQELFKGRGSLFPLGGTNWAGWGKNSAYADAAAANAATDSDLQTEPVFRKDPSGSSSEPDIFDSGLNQDEINELLAKGIPALSPPMGRGIGDWDNPDPNLDVNIDMETLKTGWGRDPNDQPYGNWWLHGDWKKMAYIHTHKLFELIVEEGDLK